MPRPLGRTLAIFLGLDMKRQPPAVGQFTYYEKIVSFPIWTTLLALIVLTGFVKALKYVAPVPGGVLWWASALHVAAMILLAAKFLDHLRYVFEPSRWPLLGSMFTTWISERYVQLRHPAWYRTMVVERSAAAPSAGDASHLPTGAPAAPAPAQGSAE